MQEETTHIFTKSFSIISARKVEMTVQVEVIRREFSYTKNCFLTLIRNLNSRISLLCLFYQAFFQACHHLSLRVGILREKSKTPVTNHLHNQVICESG